MTDLEKDLIIQALVFTTEHAQLTADDRELFDDLLQEFVDDTNTVEWEVLKLKKGTVPAPTD